MPNKGNNKKEKPKAGSSKEEEKTVFKNQSITRAIIAKGANSGIKIKGKLNIQSDLPPGYYAKASDTTGNISDAVYSEGKFSVGKDVNIIINSRGNTASEGTYSFQVEDTEFSIKEADLEKNVPEYSTVFKVNSVQVANVKKADFAEFVQFCETGEITAPVFLLATQLKLVKLTEVSRKFLKENMSIQTIANLLVAAFTVKDENLTQDAIAFFKAHPEAKDQENFILIAQKLELLKKLM